ncbi:rod shape-determining protein [Lactobacillus delbrueckii subsp. lactis]|uniref:Cell shape-determining protein MreB n=1 Tax=Lactobacillus delbrueckii subsp. lactis TaxID=29397 RepID=A0ABD4SGC1_LACDL|nr:rod shape-determining protein [Lactobacillus delbrueckii]EGD26585.1 cell-shape-determining protein MreB [Lactobacillus delbrueckii subsp. lactis DSM 20072]KRK66577.1 cell-shape-determining protein mreb [Lactobacillus delbrueckii subsp. lactis DSM 20072]MBM6987655.1 rod shape-determining protein [Lactobacillus delbrueckii]MBO1167509.1 rod shape-determining protein [Lactobacillus delbrueckii subsp. lactis]MBO1169399.1 rod shape-determining protein [Lactobacillus delbrueckii subsp. lactis]
MEEIDVSKDIGIDLGTANVLINVSGKGIVIDEPSVVAVDTNTNKVVAVGTEAYEMVGRTPGNIRVIRPLKDGVIADFDITEAMLSYFIEKLNVKGFMSKPNILVCAPTGVTSIEQKAIIQAAEKSGGGKVYLDYEPKVAAVGAGLDIFKPQGNMVIDIGGGTTDIAILSMGEIVTSKSLRYAGDRMNQAIVNYIKANHQLLIGMRTAEAIKIEIGTATDPDPDASMNVRGRDTIDGLPKQIKVNSSEVTEALQEGLQSIIDTTKQVLQETPPELSADIIDRGIMITGGGALLKNIDKLIADSLQVPVLIAESPLESVALGTGILLQHIEKHERH